MSLTQHISLYTLIYMTKEERHNLMILETLIRHESIPVSSLSLLLDVSAVTIRKDLTELESANKLYRSHGKAVLINPYINNRSILEKEKLARKEKELIGREAASMITQDDSIIIASGSTVLAFARCIKPIHRLTVISASLKVSGVSRHQRKHRSDPARRHPAPQQSLSGRETCRSPAERILLQ